MKKSIYLLIALLLVITGSVSCKKDPTKSSDDQLRIVSSKLPAGIIGQSYATALVAGGGDGEYSWSILNGSLPAGLNLSDIGEISGNPSVKAVFNFEIQLQDKSNHSVSKAFAISVYDKLLIITESVPSAIVNQNYTYNFQASGGDGNYTWSLTSGLLPSGISLQNTGTLSGTAASLGVYNFTVKVQDNSAQNDSKTFNFNVVPPYDFIDNFSQGAGNWTFYNTGYNITNEQLHLISNSSLYYPIAEHIFTNLMDVPWMVQCETGFLQSTYTTDLWYGPYLDLNEGSTYLGISAMRLVIIKNPTSSYFSGANWVWLWFIPSLTYTWLPWDDTCYGTDNGLNMQGGMNTLEMIANLDETFTLKANGNALVTNHNAVNDLEILGSTNVTLKVISVECWGEATSETVWDNVIFNSESTDKTSVSGMPAFSGNDSPEMKVKKGKSNLTIKNLLLAKGKK